MLDQSGKLRFLPGCEPAEMLGDDDHRVFNPSIETIEKAARLTAEIRVRHQLQELLTHALRAPVENEKVVELFSNED